MNIAKQVKNIIKKLRYGIIYDYSLFNTIPNRSAIYSTLNRLVKNKKIKRFSKGKFYKVKQITEKAFGLVIKYETTYDNTSKWKQILGDGGIITGNALYNSRSLTTQHPFIVEVSHYKAKPRTTKIALETISYKKLPLKSTLKNKKSIELIDIVSNKRKILDLIERNYNNYVNKTIKQIDPKILAKTLSCYRKYIKVSFLKELHKFDQELTFFLSQAIFPKRTKITSQKINKKLEIVEKRCAKISPQSINASLQTMKISLNRPITQDMKTFIAKASEASSARRTKKNND